MISVTVSRKVITASRENLGIGIPIIKLISPPYTWSYTLWLKPGGLIRTRVRFVITVVSVLTMASFIARCISYVRQVICPQRRSIPNRNVRHHVRANFHAGMRWYMSIRHVIRLLRVRRTWASTGRSLQQFSSIFNRVTRVRGVLRNTPQRQ
jgi:hypothetical protein